MLLLQLYWQYHIIAMLSFVFKVIKSRGGYESGDLPVFFEALREERQFFDHSEVSVISRLPAK